MERIQAQAAIGQAPRKHARSGRRTKESARAAGPRLLGSNTRRARGLARVLFACCGRACRGGGRFLAGCLKGRDVSIPAFSHGACS